jgi:hypothetical protein
MKNQNSAQPDELEGGELRRERLPECTLITSGRKAGKRTHLALLEELDKGELRREHFSKSNLSFKRKKKRGKHGSRRPLRSLNNLKKGSSVENTF